MPLIAGRRLAHASSAVLWQRIVGSLACHSRGRRVVSRARSNRTGGGRSTHQREGSGGGCTRDGRRQSGRAAEEGPDMSDHAADRATETFVAYRNLLFTVAYELLGSAADAEDVLQETWLRWVKVDVGQVRDQRAYLVRITTRQSLDRLRTMRRRREAYIGSWLPAPPRHAPAAAAGR